jgi:predicted acetyltransferase
MTQERAIELLPGTMRDKSVFRNLMQLYLYDFSEYNGADPDSHGLFEYGYLDHYWTPAGRDEGRAPFLITAEGYLAGFVLKGGAHSRAGRGDVEHGIAEFFVMRKWRRSGVGRQAAFELFDRFPGRWEVAQKRSNTPAQAFWLAVIGEYTRGGFENADLRTPDWDGFVQCFMSGR